MPRPLPLTRTGSGAARQNRLAAPTQTGTAPGCVRSETGSEVWDQIQSAFGEAITSAYNKGYQDGLTAGRRRAKGKSQFPRARGRPKTLHDINALQFIDFVDERIADGEKVVTAVAQYVDVMRRYNKAEGISNSLFDWKVFELTEAKARGVLIRLYRLIKKGTHKMETKNQNAYMQLKDRNSKT